MLTPDGRRLVMHALKRTMIWDLQSADAASTGVVLLEGRGRVLMSPDGHWLNAYNAEDKTGKAGALLFDLRAADAAGSRRVLDNAGEASAISPDSTWLVINGKSKVPMLWRVGSQPSVPIAMNGHTDHLYSVAFSADSRWLVTGSYDHTVRLWDLHASDLSA